jgi:hypothetical protein
MNSKVSVIVVSKNRACQLNWLLASIRESFQWDCNININVIYKYTDVNYKRGYDRCRELNSDLDINWIEETLLTEQIVQLVKNNFLGFVQFVMDDLLFLRDFSFTPSLDALSYEDIFSVSHDFHPNIKYTRDFVKIKPPNFIRRGELFLWDWRKYEIPSLISRMRGRHEWNCPTTIDGRVYRCYDVYTYLTSSRIWNNIWKMEVRLKEAAYKLKKINYHACFENQSIVNICVNCVRNKKGTHSLDELNGKFLDGYELDINSYRRQYDSVYHRPDILEWKKT